MAARKAGTVARRIEARAEIAVARARIGVSQ